MEEGSYRLSSRSCSCLDGFDIALLGFIDVFQNPGVSKLLIFEWGYGFVVWLLAGGIMVHFLVLGGLDLLVVVLLEVWSSVFAFIFVLGLAIKACWRHDVGLVWDYWRVDSRVVVGTYLGVVNSFHFVFKGLVGVTVGTVIARRVDFGLALDEALTWALDMAWVGNGWGCWNGWGHWHLSNIVGFHALRSLKITVQVVGVNFDCSDSVFIIF